MRVADEESRRAEAAFAHKEQVDELQTQLREAEEAQRWVVSSLTLYDYGSSHMTHMRAVDGTWGVVVGGSTVRRTAGGMTPVLLSACHAV